MPRKRPEGMGGFPPYGKWSVTPSGDMAYFNNAEVSVSIKINSSVDVEVLVSPFGAEGTTTVRIPKELLRDILK